LFFSTNVYSHELSLDDVIISVKERFPLILALEQQLIDAEGSRKSAQGEFDLKWKSKATILQPGYYRTQRFESTLEKPLEFMGMNVYGGYRQGDGKFAIYDEKYETLNGGEIHSGFGLPLLRNREIDERRASLKSADIELNQASQDVELKKIYYVLKASEKYWTWVAYGQREKIARDLLGNAENRIYGLRERVKQGGLANIELVDNERSVLQRKEEAVQIARLFLQSSLELSLFLRDENGNPIVHGKTQLPKIHKGRFPKNFRLDKLLSKAYQNRPELKSLELEKKLIDVQLQLSENQLEPKLDVFMELSKDLGSGSNTNEQAELESGLVIEIPLQRRKAEGKLISNNAKLSKLSREIEFTKNKIKAEVQDAIFGLQNAAAQVEIIREELKLARQVESGERERFKAGESTILLVNLREVATADTAKREVTALAEYQMEEARLKAALGESW